MRHTRDILRHSEWGHTDRQLQKHRGGYTEAEAHVQVRELRDRVRDTQTHT